MMRAGPAASEKYLEARSQQSERIWKATSFWANSKTECKKKAVVAA
jgi:hypothetical protein